MRMYVSLKLATLVFLIKAEKYDICRCYPGEMGARVRRFETPAGKNQYGGRVVKLIRRHYVKLELDNLPGTAPPQ